MTRAKRTKTMNLMVTVVLILAVTFPLFTQPSQAAVPKLDQIRVTLFIDTRGTVPSVTFSSADGLHIGVRHPSGVNQWITHDSFSPVRGSIDQYMLFLLETSDYILASALAQKADGLVGESFVISQSKKGKTVYRVYVGQFTSEGQARIAGDRLASELFLKDYNLEITGPLHWNAGTYASESEAKKQLDLISYSGLQANLVYHENKAGKLVYSVWVGEAVNPKQLDQIKAEAAKSMPSLKLQPIDSSLAYLLKRNEMQVGASGSAVPHYFFNSAGQRVWISSETSNIQVKERYNRTYRGSIELSQYKDRLAVINELPFEHYLYSVVSSELSSSWPTEALKAQAVAARTFALKMEMKYNIAHVSDTTFEQAYKGASAEFPAASAAVQATEGEVLIDKNGLIEAFYFSNAGGMTADAREIWETPLDYIKSVPSPDEIAQEGKLLWNHVVLPSGVVGYVRSDFTKKTDERNPAGFPYLEGQGSGVNVRSAPYIDDVSNPPVGQINFGDRLILFEQTIESNAYSWVRGPFTAEQLREVINRTGKSEVSGKLKTLEVSKRGPSGRVVEMKANGKVIEVTTPDSYRTAMGGLLSTRFDVEESGRYTVLGANGQRHFPENNNPLHVVSGDNVKPLTFPEMFVINAKSEARLLTKEPQFRFIGLGFGHGIGLSQWGARELAEFVGYDYQEILKYYYHDVSIVKG